MIEDVQMSSQSRKLTESPTFSESARILNGKFSASPADQRLGEDYKQKNTNGGLNSDIQYPKINLMSEKKKQLKVCKSKFKKRLSGSKHPPPSIEFDGIKMNLNSLRSVNTNSIAQSLCPESFEKTSPA